MIFSGVLGLYLNITHLVCVFSLSGNPVALSKIGLGCGVQVFPLFLTSGPQGLAEKRAANKCQLACTASSSAAPSTCSRAGLSDIMGCRLLPAPPCLVQQHGQQPVRSGAGLTLWWLLNARCIRGASKP